MTAFRVSLDIASVTRRLPSPLWEGVRVGVGRAGSEFPSTPIDIADTQKLTSAPLNQRLQVRQ